MNTLDPWSPRLIGTITAILLLISVVGGGFGELYVPSKLIVAGDAGATAKNVHNFQSLFRWSFACYVVEALCDVGLTLVLYLLLRSVSKELALLATLLRIVSTAVFAAAELFYFAAGFIFAGTPYLKAFPQEQLNALGMLSFKLYGNGAIVPTIFYGGSWIILGYLISRSRYLPKLIGILLAIGGSGFVIRNFALILAPEYASSFLLLPMLVAILLFALWLLVKGVDLQRWKDAAAEGLR